MTMVPANIKKTFSEMPLSAKQFAKTALLLMLLWLMAYSFILQPLRIPDKWLTNVTANVTSFLLKKWYSPGFSSSQNTAVAGAVITLNGKKALYIADGCNALELYVLYAAFLLCLPAAPWRMAFFTAGGIATIFVLNITRCYALTWMALNKPAWVNFAHHYAFTLVVYSCIFALWMWYGKKYTPVNEKA